MNSSWMMATTLHMDGRARFVDLPDELLLDIYSRLSDADIMRLSQVNQNLRRLAMDNEVWERCIPSVWRPTTAETRSPDDMAELAPAAVPLYHVHVKRQQAYRQYKRAVWASPFLPHSLLLTFFRVLLRPHTFRPPAFVRVDGDPMAGSRRTFWCLSILLSYLPSVLLSMSWGRPLISLCLVGAALLSYMMAAFELSWSAHLPSNLCALVAAYRLGGALRDAELLILLAAATNGLVLALCFRARQVGLSRGVTTFSSSLGLLAGLCLGVGGLRGILELVFIGLLMVLGGVTHISANLEYSGLVILALLCFGLGIAVGALSLMPRFDTSDAASSTPSASSSTVAGAASGAGTLSSTATGAGSGAGPGSDTGTRTGGTSLFGEDDLTPFDERLMQPMKWTVTLRLLLFPIIYAALCASMVVGSAAGDAL